MTASRWSPDHDDLLFSPHRLPEESQATGGRRKGHRTIAICRERHSPASFLIETIHGGPLPDEPRIPTWPVPPRDHRHEHDNERDEPPAAAFADRSNGAFRHVISLAWPTDSVEKVLSLRHLSPSRQSLAH